MKNFNRAVLIGMMYIFTSVSALSAQSVYPLVPGITVDSVMEVQQGATKIAMDPVSGHLFYSTNNGNIYEVYMPGAGLASDSLRFTPVDHGITTLQGLFFRDSILYLCGNVWSATTGIGKVVKGVLQPNGSRIWSNVVTTDPYPSASSSGDHGFTGIHLDPAGNYIYISSGARTHLGEIRDNNGAWPGYREVPITSKIFRFPVNTNGLVLPNDSVLLDNGGYVYAWGTRNAYSMAWDGNDNLFAIDNSGERDDPEELNWLRQGHNYGYPWRMGGNDNPLQFSPYNVNLDPLVNHLSGGYLSGWFNDDPTFPPVPSGVTFSEPIRNYGTAADFYRDAVTGQVKNATDEGTWISSFTAHRTPLGLIYDRDSMLATPFRGDGFMVSFMPGGDSTGYTPISPWGSPCPFVDPVRDLIQLEQTFNATTDNYDMITTRLVEGFYLPVDATITNNLIYVIENSGSIWKITMPAYVSVPEIQNQVHVQVYPNPFSETATLSFTNPDKKQITLTVYDAVGRSVRTIQHITGEKIDFKRGTLTSGIYFFELHAGEELVSQGKLVMN